MLRFIFSLAKKTLIWSSVVAGLGTATWLAYGHLPIKPLIAMIPTPERMPAIRVQEMWDDAGVTTVRQYTIKDNCQGVVSYLHGTSPRRLRQVGEETTFSVTPKEMLILVDIATLVKPNGVKNSPEEVYTALTERHARFGSVAIGDGPLVMASPETQSATAVLCRTLRAFIKTPPE